MNALQIFLALLFASACVYTVIGYPTRYGALSRRSQMFRTIGMALTVFLLGLILLGTLLDFRAGVPPLVGSIRALAYGMACMFLALTLLCIAGLDWLEAMSVYRKEQRRLFHKIVTPEIPAEDEDDAADGPADASGKAESGDDR